MRLRLASGNRFRRTLMGEVAVLGSGEIAFIDPGVPYLPSLLGFLREDVRAVVLDPKRDAVEQIAEALVPCSGLRTIHIIAHGAPGEIRFSAGKLSLAS